VIQEFYSKLSEKEKKIFYVATMLILFAFTDRLFLGPVLSRMKLLDEEIIQQESSVQRDLRFLSYKDRIRNESKKVSSYYSTEVLTEEEIIAAFLKKLEIMATQVNINLIKVSPSEGEQKKGYLEYSANLECNGNFENIIQFMHLIDTTEELIKISKISITPKKGKENNVQAAMVVAKIIVDADEDTSPPELIEEINGE